MGDVTLHERPKTGTFKLKQEANARNESVTINVAFELETNWCHQVGIFDAFV